MAHPPEDAGGQHAGQCSVNRGVRLAENERQFRRIDERHPAEEVENLSIGDCHTMSVAKEGRAVHPSHGSAGVWEGSGRRSRGRSSSAEEPVKSKVRSRVPVRVAVHLGAGSGDGSGRRGALGQKTQWEDDMTVDTVQPQATSVISRTGANGGQQQRS